MALSIGLPVRLREESPAHRQYRERVDRLWGGFEKLTDQQVKSVLTLLADTRRTTVERLMRLADKDGWKPFQLRMLRDAIDDTAKQLLAQYRAGMDDSIQKSWDFGASVTPDAVEPLGVQLRYVQRLSPLQLTVAQEVAADLVVRVTDEFKAQTRRIVTIGMMGQEGPFQVMKRIESLLRTEPTRTDLQLGSIPYQAERIQRTEMLAVANIANEMRQRQFAATVPGMLKYWLTAQDGRVRDSHVTAGRRYAPGGDPGPIAFEDDYSIGGFPASMPHDPRLPARETVMCRCRSVMYNPEWFGEGKVAEATHALWLPVIEHLPGKHRQLDHAGKKQGEETPDNPEAVASALRVAEKGIRYSPVEIAVVIDGKGIPLLRKRGDQESVTFTDSQIAAMRGATMTHNHPDGLRYDKSDPRSAGNSFSITDMGLATRAELREMRVVTPKLRFVLKPPTGGWSGDWYTKNLHKIVAMDRKVEEESWAAIHKNDLHPHEASARHWHLVWTRLAPQLGITYTREEL